MRKTLFILGCILMVLQLEAIQVRNLKKIVTLPDGTTLTLFLSGDEYSNRLHDENDYSLMKGKDGYYYYAVKDQNGKIVPSKWRFGQADPEKLGIAKGLAMPVQKSNDIPGDTPPRIITKGSSIQNSTVRGNAKNIVICINFKNGPEFENPRGHYESWFNDPDSISLRNYYKEVSYGKLNLESVFFPKCGPNENKTHTEELPRSEYEGDITISTNGFFKRAIEGVRKEIEETFTADELDLDEDGFIDYITFYVQGAPGEWSSFLWPHGMSLSSIDGLKIHNKRVGQCLLMLEKWGDRGYVCRTLAHETFHIIGCMDYYQYEGRYVTAVDEFELMASSRGHMSAYSKWKYSKGQWIKDIPEITTSGRYSLKPLISGSDSVCYKIASPIAGQYVVVEFRKKKGNYEGTLPGSGLVAYRIKQQYAGNQGRNFELYIYRPGGSTTKDGEMAQAYLSKEAGRTALGRDTDPRLFFTNPEDVELTVKNNFEITDISSAEGDRIYFTVTFDTPKRDTIYVREGGAGRKDGSSWANAIESLDEAFKKCTSPAGSEIWMAAGSYSQTKIMNLTERINVYGGFAGTENSIHERKMKDLNNNSRIEPWEFENPTILNFSTSARWNKPVSSGYITEWNGLTLNQLRNIISLESGYVFNACIVQNGVYGGFDFKGNGMVKNSYLTGNNAGSCLLNLSDGGQVEGCVITKNWSQMASLIMIGHGYISNSLITNNEMMGIEPPVYTGKPGITFSPGTIFWGGTPILANSTGYMQNCTIGNNKTDNSEGWISGDEKNKIKLYNTILWGNLPSNGLNRVNTSDVKYCAIEGYNAADYDNNQIEKNICLSPENQGTQTGVFYPLFGNPSSAAGYSVEGWQGMDWTLAEGSAAIDNGSNDWVAEGISHDLKAIPRIMHGRVDIGAYEFEQKLAAIIEFTLLEKKYTGKALLPEYMTDPADLEVQLSFSQELDSLPTNAGAYNVTASVNNPLYEGSLANVFTIQKADQEIKWEQELGQLSDREIQLLATASSELPVRYESSDESIATVEGDVLKPKKSGTCTISAFQDGDINRNAAPVISKSIEFQVAGTEIQAVNMIIADGWHSSLFKILNAESLSNSRLLFYNSLGKLVCDRKNYANDYDMGNLSSGTYYYVLTWRGPEGTICTKKGFVEVIK